MSEHEVFLHAAIALKIITRQQAQKHFIDFKQTNEKFSQWICSRGLSVEQVLQIEQYIKMHQTRVQPQTNQMEHSFFIESNNPERFQETMEIETQQLNLVPGTQFNHYTIQKELGQGGMGIVYQALDKKLQRVVALKVIKASIELNDEQIRRFASEARAVAKINHSSIVKIFEIGDSPEHYLAMEYIPGKTLKECLKSKKWTPKAIARFIRRCALALDFVHNKNIIHRDLKPSNIMLDQADSPKIADFGLAKEIDRKKSASSGFVGTPSYASPEQVGGAKNISSATDIYSLGAVLYELLTKRPPYQGESILNIFFQILNRDLVAPRTLNPDIPRELEAICLKSMNKSPKSRYRNMREFARDLQNYVEDKPVIAKPPSYVEKMAKFVKRNRLISSLIFSTFLACLVVIIYLLEVVKLKENMLDLEINISKLQTKEKNLISEGQRLKDEGQRLKDEGQRLKKEEKKLISSIAQQRREIKNQEHKLKKQKKSFYQQEIDSLHNSIQRDGNSKDIEDRLDKIQSLENWEWRWLYHQKDKSLHTFNYNKEGAIYSHFEPNGLVKSFFSHRSFVWKLKGKKQAEYIKKANIMYKKEALKNIKLSPDKKTYICIYSKGVIILENYLTKERTVIQRPNKNINEIADVSFREDSRKALVWGLGTIYIVDCIQAKIVLTIDISGLGINQSYSCYFISKDTLLFCSKTHVYKVNLSKVKKKVLNFTETLRSNKSIIEAINFSYISTIEKLIRTPKFWVIANNSTLYIYNLQNKRLLPLSTNNRLETKGMALSPDQKYLVSWDNNNIRLWSVDNKRMIGSFFGHVFKITACNFSKDNKYLFSHDLTGNVKVWNLLTKNSLNYKNTSILHSKTIDNLLINVGTGKVTIWNLQNKKLLGKHITMLEHNSVDAIKIAPGRYLIIAGHLANNGLSVFVWDGKNLLLEKFYSNIHQKFYKTKRPSNRAKNNIPNCFFVKYQGEQLLVTTFLNSVFIWDKRLWNENNASPRQIFTLDKRNIREIIYNEYLQCFCIINNVNIYLWKPFTQKFKTLDSRVIKKQTQVGDYKSAVLFDRGQKIIIGDERGHIFLFKLKTLKVEKLFQGHFDMVTVCQLNKKETRLISTDVKGNVNFWDMTDDRFNLSPLLKVKFSSLYSFTSINQVIIVEEGPKTIKNHILFTSREATRILDAPFIKIKK
ncbi:protein kinase [Candidatus Uabimicrobium sp. HlEnr_7]|uniref:protein kinase domain-containing protein n=1 Tax=Candidatus Uabimicrobium helgolandensis TaxID=3095367 RepID=UPI0035573383